MTAISRTGPRHPRLGAAGFRAAEWLATRLFALAGFHRLGSAFAADKLAEARTKLARGETLYLAGLGPPGTHNSGVALVEVTQAHGPRLILNNEEERFSGNKHTTEYPRACVTSTRATPELCVPGGPRPARYSVSPRASLPHASASLSAAKAEPSR